MKMTPKRMTRTLVSILRKLDAVQDLLAGDDDVWLEKQALDKADTYVLAVRNRLRRLIYQLDPQAARDMAAAERQEMMEDIRRAGPGVVLESCLVYALNHGPHAEPMCPESTGPGTKPHTEKGGTDRQQRRPRTSPATVAEERKGLRNV